MVVHFVEGPDCIGPCRPFCRSLYRLLQLLWEALEVHCYSPRHGLALGPGPEDTVHAAGDGQGPGAVQIAVGAVGGVGHERVEVVEVVGWA